MKGRVAVAILLCLAILLGLFVLSTNEDNLIGTWTDGSDATMEFKRSGKGEYKFTEKRNIDGVKYKVPQTINFEWDARMGLLDMYVEVLWEEIEIVEDALFFVIGDTLIIIYDGEIEVLNSK